MEAVPRLDSHRDGTTVGGRRNERHPSPSSRGQVLALGSRIRALRKEQGLTLAKLGAQAGVTRSFLSQVENGISTPSIQTLRNIALALGSPVFALFEDEQNHRMVVRKHERKRIRAAHSPVEYELLSPDLRRNIEVIMMELEPGQVSNPARMAHHGEECATVLQGRARVEIGEEYFDLEEGDSIYFQSDVPHRVLNLGKTKMLMISAITPPTF